MDDIATTNADRIYVNEDNQALSTEVDRLCVDTWHHYSVLHHACHTPLSQDIEELRTQGVSGEEIVERLAQGNKNFEKKTEFAQKKWLKRKAKKYCPYAIVRRPCASTICEVVE